MSEATLRRDVRAIWQAAVGAADPQVLVPTALRGAVADRLLRAGRVLVVGGGKAGAAMAAAVEQALEPSLDRIEGVVNIPEGSSLPCRRIVLHPARPAGSNHPTAAGVAGTDLMLKLIQSAGPNDAVLCLLSGGGSALLPAPAEGISLEDKLAITKALHACGAAIDEMNAVRKHLSRLKGGRLAQQFRGRQWISLIISDVVGDSLDVIASGPTAPDPTTFADALGVLRRFQLVDQAPTSVIEHLRRGEAGQIPETPKTLSDDIDNRIIGSNSVSLQAAMREAEARGYRVVNLGSFVEGETRQVAIALAGILRSIREHGLPIAPPACLLVGGETTVTLGAAPGTGGRNQEFVLASLAKLGSVGMQGVVLLSGGTDGEDGPTDAAGALAGESTLAKAAKLGLSPVDHLDRHDAYPFFAATGDLLQTGPTHTNVMDVRVLLVE